MSLLLRSLKEVCEVLRLFACVCLFSVVVDCAQGFLCTSFLLVAVPTPSLAPTPTPTHIPVPASECDSTAILAIANSAGCSYDAILQASTNTSAAAAITALCSSCNYTLLGSYSRNALV